MEGEFGGDRKVENVKTPYVHTFLQYLVTFGIFRSEYLALFRKLVVGLAWCKQTSKKKNLTELCPHTECVLRFQNTQRLKHVMFT